MREKREELVAPLRNMAAEDPAKECSGDPGYLDTWIRYARELMGQAAVALAAPARSADSAAREKTKTCDACGSGNWHPDWDESRKSGKWFCPNCTGAT